MLNLQRPEHKVSREKEGRAKGTYRAVRRMGANVRKGMTIVVWLRVIVDGLAVGIDVLSSCGVIVRLEVHVVIAVIIKTEGRRGWRSGGH